MSQSFAHNAISLLIDLAQQGEIDPWDVQVVEVFDRFLSELTFQDNQELASSGQAFLYASMLVLLKAETLAAVETEAAEEFEELYAEEDPFTGNGLPLPLEGCLLRRPVARPPQRRRVTLPELIHQLELMAVAVERQSRRPRVRKVRQLSRAKAAKTITELAHQENLSEVAEELEQILARLSPEQDWLDLNDLLAVMDDRVGIFWALLLLCSQSKVELDQSEFYRDLRLRPLSVEQLPATDLRPSLNSAAS